MAGRAACAFAALALLGCPAEAPRPTVAAAPEPAAPPGPELLGRPMVDVPAGVHRPLLVPAGGLREVPVAAFRLDAYPVTNAELLAFVRADPAWRRSRVARLHADERYLAHWAGDLDLGAAPPRAPAVNVSWFAARAFARWCGRRLPTVAEWELAASPASMGEPDLARRVLDWYGRPAPEPLPDVGSTRAGAHGAWDLHGLVWEWTEDWNGGLLSGDGRDPREGALFCGGGAAGAATPGDYAAFMRAALRTSLRARDTTRSLGFRCASSAAAGGAP